LYIATRRYPILATLESKNIRHAEKYGCNLREKMRHGQEIIIRIIYAVMSPFEQAAGTGLALAISVPCCTAQ
jgi:hypothetical protein